MKGDEMNEQIDKLYRISFAHVSLGVTNDQSKKKVFLELVSLSRKQIENITHEEREKKFMSLHKFSLLHLTNIRNSLLHDVAVVDKQSKAWSQNNNSSSNITSASMPTNNHTNATKSNSNNPDIGSHNSDSNNYNKVVDLSKKNSTVYNMLCRRRSKWMYHPDIEPDDDDDDDDDVDCNCIICNYDVKSDKENGDNDVVLGDKGDGVIWMPKSKKSNLKNKSNSESGHNTRGRKRQAETPDNEGVARKIRRLQSLDDVDFFEPQASSTPLVKKHNTELFSTSKPVASTTATNSKVAQQIKSTSFVLRPIVRECDVNVINLSKRKTTEDYGDDGSGKNGEGAVPNLNKTFVVSMSRSESPMFTPPSSLTSSGVAHWSTESPLFSECFLTPSMPSRPTATPSSKPTATPSSRPTATPSSRSTVTPSSRPTATPSSRPTATPSSKPATHSSKPATPSSRPTATPSSRPTATPSSRPAVEPSTYDETITLNLPPLSDPVYNKQPTNPPSKKLTPIISPKFPRPHCVQSSLQGQQHPQILRSKSHELKSPTKISDNMRKVENAIELFSWSLVENGSNYSLVGNICLQGGKCIKIEPSDIKCRHGPRLIETSDLKFYKLKSRFVKSKTNIFGIFQDFRDGFPTNWKEILDEVSKERKLDSPKGLNATFDIKEQNGMRKVKKSLNSSFFDLPEGKGTPEAPLTCDDLHTTRKSGRRVIPPLAWWKNQRVLVDPRTNETTILEGCKDALGMKVIHFKT